MPARSTIGRTNVFVGPAGRLNGRASSLRRSTCTDDVRASVLVSSDLGQHTAWLREILDAGVDDLYLHHVPREQRAFIDAFAAKVLPDLRNGAST